MRKLFEDFIDAYSDEYILLGALSRIYNGSITLYVHLQSKNNKQSK